MIDIGWSELLTIAVVMIVVVGPKDLPAVLRGFGRMTRKVRGMADEFRRGVDDFIRESELNELKDGVNQVRNFNLDRLRAETERQVKDSVGETTIAPGKPTDESTGTAATASPSSPDSKPAPAGQTATTNSETAAPPSEPDGSASDESPKRDA